MIIRGLVKNFSSFASLIISVCICFKTDAAVNFSYLQGQTDRFKFDFRIGSVKIISYPTAVHLAAVKLDINSVLVNYHIFLNTRNSLIRKKLFLFINVFG